MGISISAGFSDREVAWTVGPEVERICAHDVLENVTTPAP
jgi:hypothetical protein